MQGPVQAGGDSVHQVRKLFTRKPPGNRIQSVPHSGPQAQAHSARRPHRNNTQQASSRKLKWQFCGHDTHPRKDCPARNEASLACVVAINGHFRAVCRTTASKGVREVSEDSPAEEFFLGAVHTDSDNTEGLVSLKVDLWLTYKVPH